MAALQRSSLNPAHPPQIQVAASQNSSFNEAQAPRIHLPTLQNNSQNQKRFLISSTGTKSKKPKIAMYQNIRLPRRYKIILIPHNGTEGHVIPTPRQNTEAYQILHELHMIQIINFEHGESDYCRQQILTVFHEFQLEEWKFYRANARSTLIPVQNLDCHSFDLSDLAEYVLFIIYF